MAPSIRAFLIATTTPPPFPFHCPFHTSPKDPDPTHFMDSRSSGITSKSLLERDRGVGLFTSGSVLPVCCSLVVIGVVVVVVVVVVVIVSADVDVEVVVVSVDLVAEAIVVFEVVVSVTYASISKQITRLARGGRAAEGEEEKRGEKGGTTCELAISSWLKGMRLETDFCCGIVLREETSCFINEHICTY